VKRSVIFIVILITLVIGGFIAFKYWSSYRIDDGVVAFKQGDYEKSFQLLYPLSELGNKTAKRLIGLSYAYGLGVDVNPDMAFDFLMESEKEPLVTFKEISEVYRVGNEMVKANSELYGYWVKRSTEVDPKSWTAR
jgi:hypothetical protein